MQDIKTYSAIPKEEIIKALLYLCNPRNKILNKENMDKPQFPSTEIITVNDQFSNKSLRV